MPNVNHRVRSGTEVRRLATRRSARLGTLDRHSAPFRALHAARGHAGYDLRASRFVEPEAERGAARRPSFPAVLGRETGAGALSLRGAHRLVVAERATAVRHATTPCAIAPPVAVRENATAPKSSEAALAAMIEVRMIEVRARARRIVIYPTIDATKAGSVTTGAKQLDTSAVGTPFMVSAGTTWFMMK